MLTEANDLLYTGRTRSRGEPFVLRNIAIDDRRAIRLNALKNFGFRIGDVVDRAKEFQMYRLNRGDDRHMRPHQPCERRNLAGMIHAEFKDGETRALRATRERQRHAPMII